MYFLKGLLLTGILICACARPASSHSQNNELVQPEGSTSPVEYSLTAFGTQYTLKIPGQDVSRQNITAMNDLFNQCHAALMMMVMPVGSKYDTATLDRELRRKCVQDAFAEAQAKGALPRDAVLTHE